MQASAEPLKLLLSLMGTALEEGTEVRLGPLPFTPRATNLNEGNLLKELRDPLESILRLLKG